MGKLLLLLMLMLVAVAVAQEERNIITHIKGFDGPLPFSLETGYVEVEETHGVQLFYYFIQSERNPAEDPLILWISGGPGCSALNALFFEMGPLKIDVAASYGSSEGFPRLVYFEDSWTKVSSVIFLDAPVGTGFSYAAREPEGLNISLTGTSRHVRTFLQEWLVEHPEFASNPLYLAGDSFSGYTIPVTALEIADANANANEGGGGAGLNKLNLVGYMVGNPTTADKYDHNARVPFMHGMGLISDELYQAARGTCQGDYVSPNPRNARCTEALQAISLATSDVNSRHILEPTCPETRLQASSSTSLVATRSRLLLVREEEEEEEEDEEEEELQVECRANGYLLSYVWADDTEVREMLGIRKGSIGSWSLCTIPPQFQYDVPSPIPYHRNLTQRGYRALVYNGDHDVSIPFLGTQAWIRTLGYPVVAPWRPWYDSKHQLAGFTTEYAYNLTFATVKGGGHMAPEARPKECLHMLRRWTSPAGRL